MTKIYKNIPQQQQQQRHSGKYNISQRQSTKGAAIMGHTKGPETISATTATAAAITATTTTTRATPTPTATSSQCLATRWSSARTADRPTTANPSTTSASSTTMSRNCGNNSDRRWPAERGVAQSKLPWLLLLLLVATTATHATAEKWAPETPGSWGGSAAAPGSHSRVESPIKYSRPLVATSVDNDDTFRPIIPKDISPEYISRNVFTETGQYRVFQSVDSDLRLAAAVGYKAGGNNERPPTTLPRTSSAASVEKQNPKITSTRSRKASPTQPGGAAKETQPPIKSRAVPAQPTRKHETASVPVAGFSNALNNEMKGLEELLVEYVENFFNKGQYEPLPGLVFALQKNHTDGAAVPVPVAMPVAAEVDNNKKRPVRHLASTPNAGGSISINIPRAVESGRLFFFSGLKKIMWPIFMGLQILKSLLFAMFLPTLIGSFGKLLGKGIVSGSSPLFIRPAEAPQELDFRDNTFNFDDDTKFGMHEESGKDEAYAYNQAEASQTQNQYAYNPAAINQQALSRYGNEQNKMQDSYLSALQSISSASFKNSNSISGSSSAGGIGGGGGNGLGAPLRNKPAAPANTNTYQTFQKVPASSLLLSNYDPFYSPLLSRLDSVFAQLKLNSESESCREKLICLMYSNPAKYAPYSNLVSAQLSRELNELRKPTSDNPDILRFFKYMRAAKDGQDGVDCEKSFDRCKEFKDFENPAMVSTYHDINKLVQARKLA